jgi:hypothetical protein
MEKHCDLASLTFGAIITGISKKTLFTLFVCLGIMSQDTQQNAKIVFFL